MLESASSSSPAEIGAIGPTRLPGRISSCTLLQRLRSGPLGRSRFFPVAACVLAVAIFSIDTFTQLGVAVAVLYALVVLIAAGILQRRGVLFVSIACIALTVLSYMISHGTDPSSGALIRAGMSLSAICVTTILALRYQSAGMAVRERAQLLDLTHDAVFVRDMGGIVTYWNRGAEELYGWSKDEANGQNFHALVRTAFPAPLETIQADLMRNNRWEGELAQIRANGSRLTVASRWALRRDERGRPVGILETNTDITSRIEAREALHRAQAELAHVTRVTTLGELTASIAHEVNQPPAAIVANGQACLRWLKRDVPDLDEARSAVERMVFDCKRAGEVIWGLRMLARKADPQWGARLE